MTRSPAARGRTVGHAPARTAAVLALVAVVTAAVLVWPPPVGAAPGPAARPGPTLVVADPIPGPGGVLPAETRFVVAGTGPRAPVAVPPGAARSTGTTPIAGSLHAYVTSAITRSGTPTATAAAAAAAMTTTAGPYWSAVSGGRVTIDAGRSHRGRAAGTGLPRRPAAASATS